MDGGQIPAFGDWEHANELPITQYFESARQAGLIRYSSSGECDQYMHGDLYSTDFKKPSRDLGPQRKTTRVKERRVPHPHVKEQKKQVKVCDVTEPQRRHQRQKPISMYSNVSEKNNEVVSVHPRPKLPVRVRPPKPVDEDLYKIPPELLRSSKRKKKVAGFLSCLVPFCAP
ncbi:uncharacterized protein LOC110623560 [Manihot esculenta]|uniref:RIN4 pathogenic type III effector avirulence factor Avr cleavage site domain-containing protein n=1 Tax=Manihot esculenta TaxID=3983 RepID=A0A2C9VCI8_MANES|nr:uncharacterized protein LOC110623560 [Manihot esculenta]OAY41986.1 hypothetical protein MANES_09G144900v8 [Manihot esculenta]